MKMFKRFLAAATAAALCLALGACQTNNAQNDAGNNENGGDITVAGIVYLEDQFMKMMTAGYRDAASEMGARLLTSNVNNDQAKETEQINTYVTQGVDGIAIAPLNEESSITTLRSAAASGIKIALTDSTLQNADFTVGGYTSDQKQLGQSTGEACRKFIEEKMGGTAKIAIVQFKSLLPEKSAARVDGFLEQVQQLDGVEVVADQDAWVQDDAVNVVNDILTANPDVNLIFAANDGGTVGATVAVRNAGKAGSVFVFGIDASEQIASMLQADENILQAVTGQDAYGMGYNTMKLLIQSIKNETSGNFNVGSAGGTLVDGGQSGENGVNGAGNDTSAGDAGVDGSGAAGSVAAGTIQTVDGILLSRDDAQGIEDYLASLAKIS